MGTIGLPDILDFKYLSGILVGAWLGGPTRILPLLPAVGLELGQTRQLDCLALPLLPLAPDTRMNVLSAKMLFCGAGLGYCSERTT